MLLQFIFDEIVIVYFKEVIWKDKKVFFYDQFCDCCEMLEYSEYVWVDIFIEDDYIFEIVKIENIMLVEVVVCCIFFRFCQS